MKLTLTRPLVFFDLETTGTNFTRDRIVQIAVLKLFPDMTKEVKCKLVNPGMPIPAGSTAIHGISDEAVANEPAFLQYAKGIFDFFAGSDIAGFNSNYFDLPMLAEEFARCGLKFPEPESKLIDVQTIFHKKEERTLSAAYKFYCDKELTNAHNAQADAETTLEVFTSQLERYDDLGSTVEELHEFCKRSDTVDFPRRLARDDDGEIVFNFGRHKGVRVKENLDYARWMVDADFPESTKTFLREIIGEYRVKEKEESQGHCTPNRSAQD